MGKQDETSKKWIYTKTFSILSFISASVYLYLFLKGVRVFNGGLLEITYLILELGVLTLFGGLVGFGIDKFRYYFLYN